MVETSTLRGASSKTGARDWVVMIKESIKQLAERNKMIRHNPKKVLHRVAREVRELNPKHYAASEFSCGLFDRSPLDPLKRRADRCKVAMATAVLEVMGMTEDNWEEFCSMVVPNAEEIRDHYDELDRNPFSPSEVQSVLTLDSTFLAGYIGARWHGTFAARFPSLRSALGRIIDDQIVEQIFRDLIKAENQIPLFLIRSVLLILVEKVGGNSDQLVDDTLSRICSTVVARCCSSLPGYDPKHPYAATAGVTFLECDNFLDCVHRTLVHEMTESQDEDSTVTTMPVILPSATELQKAGIEFRGRKGFHDIEFKAGIIKGTLYLPTLHIPDDAEEVWSNLVAHEHQLDYGGKGDFTQYVDLMDSLINSPNDVIILRSGRFPTIVYNGLGTDDAVAHLFNRMLLYTTLNPTKKWSKLHQEIYEFYNKGQRQMYLEFKETYFGKPWLTISVVAATVLLIMTFLQTYYTIVGYYHSL